MERYRVLPVQVPDFIALRGDPSDRLPGAKGVGEIGAAALLLQFGTLEGALRAGRLAREADQLRLFRRIATMDAKAPLPPVRQTKPTWDPDLPKPRSWRGPGGLVSLPSGSIAFQIRLSDNRSIDSHQ